jgi:hypothetical protein
MSENKSLSQDNNNENSKIKVSKPKKNTKIIYKNGCKMDLEIVTNLEKKFEFIIKACNKEYFCEILFNEERQKFQALFTFQDRRQSLSFFPLKSLAEDNIYLSIALQNGYGSTKSGVGD